MPPASKKFFAKVARAVKAETGPRLARKIDGRLQGRLGLVAQGLEGLGQAVRGQAEAAGLFRRGERAAGR